MGFLISHHNLTPWRLNSTSRQVSVYVKNLFVQGPSVYGARMPKKDKVVPVLN
jgi:hypothetical protein